MRLLILLLSGLCCTTGNMQSEIERINSIQTYWRAGSNEIADKGIQYVKILLGAKVNADPILPVKEEFDFIDTNDIPETFDARTNWSQCQSISIIRDQGKCGSCWAVASTTTMTDRLCIAGLESYVILSTQNLMSCCKYCGNGCRGGNIEKAWHYFSTSGLVTGGFYHSNQGCQPYQIRPGAFQFIKGMDVTCESCTNQNYTIPYNKDKHFGVNVYSLRRDVATIQKEILTHGPVTSTFYVYRDFVYYKSGVYVKTSDKYVGMHSVRVLGWGTENGIDYWLAANSWNTHWGMKGTFKIRRGTNECKFESFVVAGTV